MTIDAFGDDTINPPGGGAAGRILQHLVRLERSLLRRFSRSLCILINRRFGELSTPDRDLDGKDDRGEGARTGAGLGTAAGGAVGLLTGLGLMAIPGVGPVVAAGWLAATLTGAAAGGAAGGIIGALSQADVSDDDAHVYAEGLRRGGAVVSARVPDADAARLQVFMDRSSVAIADCGNAYRKSGWKTFDPTSSPYTADQVQKERSLYR